MKCAFIPSRLQIRRRFQQPRHGRLATRRRRGFFFGFFWFFILFGRRGTPKRRYPWSTLDDTYYFSLCFCLLCEASSGHALRALLADARIRKHHCCVMGNGDRIARLAMGMFPGRIFCFVYFARMGSGKKGHKSTLERGLLAFSTSSGMGWMVGRSLACFACFVHSEFNTLYRRIILLSILKISTLPVLSGLGTVLKLKAGAVHS